MADLYLFDGYNLLHAGAFAGKQELVDALASFVALRGGRGVVVFDGVGEDTTLGPLEVRHARNADTLLERIAATRRSLERVLLVTSDATLKAAAGLEVAKIASAAFAAELTPSSSGADVPHGLAGKLDEETRARLERLRRGE